MKVIDEHSATLSCLPLALGAVPASLRMALAQEGVAHAVQSSTEPTAGGRFYLYDSRSEPQPALLPGQVAINVRGLHQSSGIDALELLTDTDTMQAEWTVQDWHVHETVAKVDRRAVRDGLMRALRSRVEAAGGIWMRLSAYPYPFQSAFNFRLDCDEVAPQDFDRVMDAEVGYEDCFSHYVCGAAYEHQPEALARLRGRHVGGHGYYHHTYRDAADNLQNIGRGLEVLQAAGLEPNGFVAPHGRYNAGLAAAMNQLGLSHSSEFALCYQDWPFTPADSQVLQVPVHPLCLGLFLDTAAARREAGAPSWKCAEADAVAVVEKYFVRVLRQNHAAGEPVFLYGHPERRLGRYPQVIRGVLRGLAECSDMWRVTLAQFADWWQARQRVTWSMQQCDGGICVSADHLPLHECVAVEIFRGDSIAKVELNAGLTRIDPAQLNFTTRSSARLLTAMPAMLRGGLKARVRAFLDWELSTPLAEIRTETWRGWAKHALRRWKSEAATGSRAHAPAGASSNSTPTEQ